MLWVKSVLKVNQNLIVSQSIDDDDDDETFI